MPTDESYDRMRRDFEELVVEKQVQFLIQASASTLAGGIERIGETLADGLEDLAESETVRRRASTNEASSEKST